MALNRLIHFKAVAPTDEEVASVIRNFFGGAAEIEWGARDRWLISLPGKGSFPYAEVEANFLPPFQKERWIEVVLGNPLDVITRRQDEYTHVLATGLAEVFARYWGGTYNRCLTESD